MTRMQVGALSGGRLHLNDGPIDLVIGADGAAGEVAKAYARAQDVFADVLDALCEELTLLRRPVGEPPQGPVARRMWQATLGHGARGFITPMAAVAGAVAEEVLAAMTVAACLSRAYVNNGGDIALHLAPGMSYRIGLIDRPDAPSIFGDATIRAGDGVRGIATSGWRGRSFSLGIADAVTVLAATASAADAAATVIANAVDVPGHARIVRVPANSVQPDSDLGSRPVTRAVGELTAGEAASELDRGREVAADLISAGDIVACSLLLQGQSRAVSQAQRVLL